MKKKNILFLVLINTVILAFLGGVSAADNNNGTNMNTTQITSQKHVYINVSNENGVKYDKDGSYYGGENGTYYIKADGSGLNQLHITNNATDNWGQVTFINTNSSSSSGTFYITTTSSRGFNDDIILLLTVEGPISDNFTVNIISSGYGNWTLATTGEYTPSPPTNYQYINRGINETFTIDDFLYGPQTTRPAPMSWQTLYYGQNASNNSTAAYFMFIDLYLGNIANTDLIDGGSLKINYNFTNMYSLASFNAYAWTIASNQNEGINWCNPTIGLSSSGYTVNYTGQKIPVANFTANTTTGSTPLNVQFTDMSAYSPTSWAWDFNGDGIIDSTSKNPIWTYTTNGIYSVTLTAANSIGNSTLTKTDLIKVGNPELVANNLEIPTNPVNGTAYTVNATVTNTGLSNAGSFVAKLYDNNVQIAKTTINGLASGASTMLNFNWTPNTVGDHVLSVIADVNKQINETNRTNSHITQTVTVITASLPELTVSNLQLPINPVNGTSYLVNVTVANTGLGYAGSFIVKLYDNNVQIAKTTINGLKAGENTILNFNWTPNTVGSHTLSVIADPNNQINETNHNNNQITQTVNTTASTLPDLTATNLQLPENPVAGTTYTINVTIANTGPIDITNNFAVKLYDNNTQIQKITVNNLAAGANTILTFNWTPTTTGTHNLSVIADANKQLTETIETNNQITQAVTVS